MVRNSKETEEFSLWCKCLPYPTTPLPQLSKLWDLHFALSVSFFILSLQYNLLIHPKFCSVSTEMIAVIDDWSAIIQIMKICFLLIILQDPAGIF